MTDTSMHDDFNQLCSSPSGILLENSTILIGIRQEYDARSRGHCTLYIGNMSAGPLHHVSVHITKVHHLKLHVDDEATTEGLLDQHHGCTIAVGTQAKLVLKLHVFQPFWDSPTIHVSYTTSHGITQEHVLTLPIVATCFTMPLALGKDMFRNLWFGFEEEKDCRNILKRVPANELYMEKVKAIVEQLNFEQCLECDDTQWSVSGAAEFPTHDKDNHGHHVNIQCLVRIEADHRHRAVRVSTRTDDLVCSRAIQNVLLANIKNINLTKSN